MYTTKYENYITVWFFLWSWMDVRVGLWRRLSAEELTLLNCGVGEDSWECPGLQGDPTSPFWRKISPGISLEGMMLKVKLQYFGHLMWRVDSLEKTDAGRDWGQEKKGTTEDEMAGWHHRLNGREFEWWTGKSVHQPGVGDGQGSLACCDSWGRKESDTTERLNWTEQFKEDFKLTSQAILQITTQSLERIRFRTVCLNG